MLTLKNGFAGNLGRMRSKHGRNQGHIKKFADLLHRNPGIVQSIKRIRHAAFLRRRPLEFMRTATADMVLILGNIGQMQKIAERAHHRDHRITGQSVEKGLELRTFLRLKLGIGVMAQQNRGLTDMLNESKTILTLTVAHHISEQATEQADVFSEG